MFIERLELADFRNYSSATFDLTAGTTAIVGRNAQGKTNVAEAMAFLSTLESFRGIPPAALVRIGAEAAVIRAIVRQDDGRDTTIEVRVPAQGRVAVQVNKQRLQRSSDLLGSLRVTVFSPDDLDLVKGGPADRRRFCDDVLVNLVPRNGALRLELERVLKQRNTLLRQCSGRLTDEVAFSLDVWDERFAEVGDRVGETRATLIARLQPEAERAYGELAGVPTAVGLRYEPEWRRTGLADALRVSRADDVRRGSSTVGPHRDDIDLSLGSLPARTHASQGEMRSLALSMRLATHRLVAEANDAVPLLVLDDVLSELDPDRCRALLAHLPAGQVVITTAAPLPDEARPDRVIRIENGRVVE